MSAASPHARWLRWSLHVDEASDGRPLCLSLANTRHWRNGAAPKELLNGYADILDWAVAKSIYSRREADALVTEANAHPHVANAELRRTIELREAIARMFGALAHGRGVREGDRAIIVESFDEALRLMTLRVVDGRLVPGIAQDREGLELPRWQAAFSALGLYGSPAVARVKQCADDRGCGWLFVDTTRNASRMFCFSNECGNRARQAKYRERMRRAG